MRRPVPTTLLTIAVLASNGCSGLLRGYAEGESTALGESLPETYGATSGMVRFALDDLGTLNTDALETHALPWKVAVAALLVNRRALGEDIPLEPEAILPILREFGFVTPDTIRNWEGAPYPGFADGPVGMLRGVARRGFPRVVVEVAGLGCASCHAGVLYDESGNPTNEVWLGLPNTSLNLGAYSDALSKAYSHAVSVPDRILAALDTLYPALNAEERHTIEEHVLPGLMEEVPELNRRFGSLSPFNPGGPGTPNGVGSLKRMLGLLEETRDDEVSLAQIPDLGDRVLRTSLTVDGAYRIPGRPRFAAMTPDEVDARHLDGLTRIAAFFAMPAMGARAGRIERSVPRVREIMEYLRHYRPPPFPGPVDSALARRGRSVYDRACAECHGTYAPGLEGRLTEFPNALVAGDDIGTDPVRWQSASPDVLAVLEELDYARYLDPAPTGGYVAPPLTGLWATAPYLHNASVPTLWHLMHPELRPGRFEVGGHMLDYDRLGLAGVLDREGVFRYPEGYRPWSTPFVYDTSIRGQSNGGHSREFAHLSETQKRSLLEYLKLL
ncbi:MAG: hypothetical protein ABFS34_02170 [Gemmatimonadota bacterium]